jgi:hypothetical protein
MVCNSNTAEWLKALADMQYEETLSPRPRALAIEPESFDGTITGVFRMTPEQVRAELAEFKDGIAA